jgi:hypothetical protein
VNRPRKSLHPFPLVIHDCWFAARSLASVSPTVRRARGLAPRSGSLIFARTLSFLSAVAFESRTSRGPNSLSLRLFFIAVPCDLVFARMQPSEWRTIRRGDRLSKPMRVPRAPFAKEKASPVAPECCLEGRQIGVRAGGESRASESNARISPYGHDTDARRLAYFSCWRPTRSS